MGRTALLAQLATSKVANTALSLSLEVANCL